MKRVGFAQFEPVFGRPGENLRRVTRLAREAGKADLLVFPELAVSGYDFTGRDELMDLAEPFGEGPTSLALLELAGELNAALVIGYPERAGDTAYNSALLAVPGGALHNYRKIHLFSREKELFAPGDAPPPVADTPAGRVGMMICFDWIFPETARLLALAGAQIIAHPSNLVLSFCQRAMFARSVENRVFTITANRTGSEDRAGRTLAFTGGSVIYDPEGNLLAQAPGEGEQVSLVEVDPAVADDKQVNGENHLFGDRRTELYGGLVV
ncbi:MAG TPA: acyltransferase [Bacteroidetes bacterium]|nr:acyltransferase [Bacteroidota bacterium]